MDLENKVAQLTDLMADLTPAADSLVVNQKQSNENINNLIKIQHKSNLTVSELRLSNMRLASAIEKLTDKIDKVDEFDARLKKIESKIS